MPADSIGGPAFCGFDLLCEIDKLGQSKIISFDQSINKNFWEIQYYKKEIMFLSSSHYFCQSKLIGYFFLIKKIISYLLYEKETIFILHGIFNMPYVISSIFLRIFNCKVFIIPHGTLNRERIKISRNILVKKFSYFYLRLFHTNSNFVFTNNYEYEKSIIFKKKVKFDNNFFIPNILKIDPLETYLTKLPLSISKKVVENSTLEIWEKNINKCIDDLDKNKLNLIYFGRIAKEKGIDIFLNSLHNILERSKNLPKIHIHFIGDGNKKYLKEIDIILKRNKSNLTFSLYGWLSRDKAFYLIKRLQGIMVFPSISDNFNLSFLESILLGKLAIVSDKIATSSDLWLSKRVFLINLKDIDKSLEKSLKNIMHLKNKNLLFNDQKLSFKHPYLPETVKNKWNELINIK